jgi:hypothetical protein
VSNTGRAAKGCKRKTGVMNTTQDFLLAFQFQQEVLGL